LVPTAVAKAWGSQARSAFDEPSQAEGVNWGEIWLASERLGVATLGESSSQGRQPLGWFRGQWGQALTGSKAPEFGPVLNFSVRLERTGGSPGPVRLASEDEFWHVAEAGPQAWFAAGLRQSAGSWNERLRKVSVEPADSFLMPKGVVMVQGPFMTVLKVLPLGAELQTLHDWGRRPDPFDFPPPAAPIPQSDATVAARRHEAQARVNALHRHPNFTVTLFRTNSRTSAGEPLTVLCPVKGRGRLTASGSRESASLRPGQAVLLPAGLGPRAIESGTAISYVAISHGG
jgi:hypothetical protein